MNDSAQNTAPPVSGREGAPALTMRERLAYVLAVRKAGEDAAGESMFKRGNLFHGCLEDVDAILAELREPDVGMLDAGDSYRGATIFTAMIDAIAKQKKAATPKDDGPR